MNLGYLDDSADLPDRDSAEIGDRLSENLYDCLVGDVPLEGRSVLEVGCGLGGGSAHVTRTYAPASLTGVDLSEGGIEWCRRHHHEDALTFLQGDAMDLPVDSESVDVVLNLESSHCYPWRSRFFEEVVRVLRPGGRFLFSDLFTSSSREDPDAVSALLTEAGLTIDSRTDITSGVLAARRVASHSPALREHMRENVPPFRLSSAEDFLCMEGTPGYNQMASGAFPYVRWALTKPAV